MHSRTLCLFVVFACLALEGGAFRRRRRRRSPPPKINCAVSAWSGWQACSTSCGGGTQERRRAINRNAANGGQACPKTSERRRCNPEHCPVDCAWATWGQWGGCSPCFPVSKGRTRNVSTPALFGGRSCAGRDVDYSRCSPDGGCSTVECLPDQFTCDDRLTCTEDRFRCNGDDDCTDNSDETECSTTIETCPMTPPPGRIPNVHLAGAGFDITRNAQSGHILDNLRYKGRCLTVSSGDHDRALFRIPYNIQSYRFQVYVDTSFNTKSYESAKDFFQEEKGDFRNKLDIDTSFTFGDVFSLGAKTAKSSDRKVKTIIDRSSESDSKYFKITSNIYVAQFRNLRRNYILSVPLRERLSELPDHYDYGKYAEVIYDFGTHFYSSGELGGQYEFIYRYSREDLKESGLTDTEQKDCLTKEASFSLFKFKLGGGGTKCRTNTLSTKNGGSFTRSAREVISNVKGGFSGAAASLSFYDQHAPNSDDYDRWVETVKINPAIIYFTLRPISSVIPPGPKRINMERALVDYLERFNPERCTIPCSNGGEHVVVNGGQECKCLCAAGFVGISCAQKA